MGVLGIEEALAIAEVPVTAVALVIEEVPVTAAASVIVVA